MTAVEALALEEARRRALLSGDADALGRLLAPELRYVHSTGVCDTRESLLHKVRERAITYLALSFDAKPRISRFGFVGRVNGSFRLPRYGSRRLLIRSA
jgi:hypothetical protein